MHLKLSSVSFAISFPYAGVAVISQLNTKIQKVFISLFIIRYELKKNFVELAITMTICDENTGSPLNQNLAAEIFFFSMFSRDITRQVYEWQIRSKFSTEVLVKT